jgi:hypothetical protein
MRFREKTEGSALTLDKKRGGPSGHPCVYAGRRTSGGEEAQNLKSVDGFREPEQFELPNNITS